MQQVFNAKSFEKKKNHIETKKKVKKTFNDIKSVKNSNEKKIRKREKKEWNTHTYNSLYKRMKQKAAYFKAHRSVFIVLH